MRSKHRWRGCEESNVATLTTLTTFSNINKKEQSKKSAGKHLHHVLSLSLSSSGVGEQVANPVEQEDGEPHCEGRPEHQGHEPAVPGGEDHQDQDLRLQVLEGGVLRPHR